MLTKEQFDDLVGKVGKAAAEDIRQKFKEAEENLNKQYQEVLKGTMKPEAFEEYKLKQEETVNKIMAALDKLEEAGKKQGEAMNAILENPNGSKVKGIDDFMKAQIPQLLEFKRNGTGCIEISGAQLKAAGVTSISGSITAMTSPPGSPYLPGIAGTPLELFDIVRNANFMLNRVNMGNTDQSRLAWINETAYDGVPLTNIAESGTKPLIEHRFQLEISIAKKAAAYIKLTEEFDQDVPQLVSEIKGMLQTDVIRAFDDAIQLQVYAVAQAFNLNASNQLGGQIADANLWDAALALITQVGVNNFIPNTLAWNWIQDARIQMQKDTQARYLVPPFLDEINRIKVKANKLETGYALAGDLNQFNVRMYKDYYMKMGWINDDLIKNQFAIVGELRYHSFISDNRKSAIVRSAMDWVKDYINGTPHS